MKNTKLAILVTLASKVLLSDGKKFTAAKKLPPLSGLSVH